MTIQELILYYDGIGYRKVLECFHRGSGQSGYFNAKFFYNEYLNDNKHKFKGLVAIDMGDILADDWIGQPTKNKLLNLINN